MISTSSGEQKPPWQRPIVAPVRHLIASSESTGRGPCSARTTSASVTSQQRQTTCPNAGLLAIARSRCSSVMAVKGSCGARRGLNDGLPPAPRRAATWEAMKVATAGADVRPGDSKQAMLKNPGASVTSPMTKSPDSPAARNPAKFVIAPRGEAAGQVRRARSTMSTSPSCVVERSVLDAWETEFGPMSILP